MRNLAVSGVVLTGFNAGIWSYYLDTWYNRTTDKFQFKDDWNDFSMNFDKFGHAWTSMVVQKGIHSMARWSNVPEPEALWISSSLAWLHMFPIEIKDAYFRVYGFAWTDIAANTIGAFYPTIQALNPSLKPYNLKMSMHRSREYYDPTYYHIRNLVDDYPGRTFWLSVDVNELLPRSAEPYWPDWLCIAVGYGVENIYRSNGEPNVDRNNRGIGTKELYVAFDYNVKKVFNVSEESVLSDVFDYMNLLHFPAPTIRITPNTVVLGLYF